MGNTKDIIQPLETGVVQPIGAPPGEGGDILDADARSSPAWWEAGGRPPMSRSRKRTEATAHRRRGQYRRTRSVVAGLIGERPSRPMFV